MDRGTTIRLARVLLFCRDQDLAGRVEAIVRTEPDLRWAGAADNVDVAIRMCEEHMPDIAVIESTSDPNWKLCLMITGLFPGTRVVALLNDAANGPVAAAWALLHRASGIITVDAESDRLGVAIRNALRAGRYVDSSVELPTSVPVNRGALRGKPLSSRELQVLELVADGRTADNIGRRLGISADTVRTHVYRILRKLNARDRAHAVAIAYQTAVLSLPGPSVGRHGDCS